MYRWHSGLERDTSTPLGSRRLAQLVDVAGERGLEDPDRAIDVARPQLPAVERRDVLGGELGLGAPHLEARQRVGLRDDRGDGRLAIGADRDPGVRGEPDLLVLADPVD